MIRLERDYINRLSPIIRKQFNAAAQEVRNGNPHVSSAIERHRHEMKNAYRLLYKRTALVFRDIANAETQKGVGHAAINYLGASEKKDATFGQNFFTYLESWINKYSGQKVTKVNQTTKDTIQRIVKKKMEAGKSNADIADDIEQLGEIADKSRAATIARTETHTAAMMAIDTSIREQLEGEQLVKEWLSALDERTREEHAEAAEINGDVPVEDDFIVGGDNLKYPGDPDGEPWNVINCRCVVLYKTVKPSEADEEAA
jgi:uncharacterized protein with gpF-like domain